MNPEKFIEAVEKIAGYAKDSLGENGRVAFIISSLRKEGKVHDLAFSGLKVFENKGFRLEERIIVPYNGAESETGFWLKKAEENRFMLRKYRDLMVFS